MGSSQSVKRITIENENDPGTVIKVSDSVVERLKGGGGDQRKEKARNTGGEVPPRPPQAFITSHQIKQEVEDELKKNNEYWEKKVANLQANQEKINKLMEDEYVRAVEEMEKLLPRIVSRNSGNLCQDKKANIVKCYKTNAKQQLLCSKEVDDFTSCMTNIRVKLQDEGKLG